MNTTKKITLIGLSLSLCLFATACAKGAKAEDGGNKPVEVVETQKTSNELNQEAKNNADAKDKEGKENSNKENAKKDEAKTYKVSLVYPSEDYIVNGNEENKTVTQKTEIESDKEKVVVKVLDALAASPKAKGADSTGLDKFDYSKSTLDGSKAIVDISGDVHGGSLEEDVLVSSIVNSLLSVDGIKSVSFTVNGKPADTLMGHVDITKDFTNFVK
ncbi:hypothetical protein HMPREF1863_00683 [Aedoeadaptatus coxii]|uniref:GerMN domain-containing protein n=1 Tax=Aedoeadaptatus coxii TaxID=755172 RepID=A0A134AHQ3_9FIRM|nr:GerMN domain-containing protein [Peptoniphilus coxii]KXB67209.1 hypothetical protein HMPREF1863_00683 [Peptoniphilus coxii]